MTGLETCRALAAYHGLKLSFRYGFSSGCRMYVVVFENGFGGIEYFGESDVTAEGAAYRLIAKYIAGMTTFDGQYGVSLTAPIKKLMAFKKNMIRVSSLAELELKLAVAV